MPLRYIMWCIASFFLLEGCAPIIETRRDTVPFGGRIESHIALPTIAIVTKHLEKNEEFIDPAVLKKSFENVYKDGGFSSPGRIILSDGVEVGDAPRIEIDLDRHHSSIQALRFPAQPPCGLWFLYPLMAPALTRRDYLLLQVFVEGEISFIDSSGVKAKQIMLSETADARANFFNFGGAHAMEKLADIAAYNFSKRTLDEFLNLTTSGTTDRL